MREGMDLSIRAGAALFIWYLIVFSIGAVLLSKKLLAPGFMQDDPSLELALMCAGGAALISSSLFYIRKLYKDLFLPPGNPPSSGRIILATCMYYFSRPLFALLFAVLVVVSTATFLHATTAHGNKLSIGFVFFSILVSAYGAAVTGQIVRHLETTGMDKLRSFGGLS